MNINKIVSMKLLKIELGAGSRPQKLTVGWIHNDLLQLPHIELVSPSTELGLPENSVDGFYSHHMLEHIHYDLFPKALKYWYKLLKPEGFFHAVVPNMEYAFKHFMEEISKGNVPLSMTYRCIWGTRDAGTEGLPPNNVHHNGFTKDLLVNLAKQAGFINCKATGKDRFGFKERDIILKCEKPC